LVNAVQQLAAAKGDCASQHGKSNANR